MCMPIHQNFNISDTLGQYLYLYSIQLIFPDELLLNDLYFADPMIACPTIS